MTNLSPTAENILDCARSLIVAGGYNGFSYADIAGVVGIRKASIHHHFPSKADLVQALVARYRAQAREGLAQLSAHVTDPARQLEAYLGYWRNCIADNSAPICVSALLASEIPLLPDAVAAEVQAHFRSLAKWLEGALARGEAEGSLTLTSAPKIEAEAFMATVHGAMLSARAYGDADIFATVTRSLMQKIMPAI